MLACTSGDVDIVKLILCNPSLNINQLDHQGINAIYVCAYYGHFELLKLLKQHGGVYAPSNKGTTVLHVAAKKGYIDILKYLLHESKNQKIHVDSRKKNGMTASMLAV